MIVKGFLSGSFYLAVMKKLVGEPGRTRILLGSVKIISKTIGRKAIQLFKIGEIKLLILKILLIKGSQDKDLTLLPTQVDLFTYKLLLRLQFTSVA